MTKPTTNRGTALPDAATRSARPRIAVEGDRPTRTALDGTPVCVHWWRLPAPNGPTVEGVCKRCSETRMFLTATDDNRWGRL